MASSKAVEVARGLGGAVVGGVVGYYGYFWMLDENYFYPSLPGLMVGAGAGLISKTQSTIRGVLCGIAGLALSVVAFWQSLANAPGLGSFVTHIHQRRKTELFLLALAGIGGYWFGRDTIVFGGKRKRKKGAYVKVDPDELAAQSEPPTIKS